jgi:hypothetical protein
VTVAIASSSPMVVNQCRTVQVMRHNGREKPSTTKDTKVH